MRKIIGNLKPYRVTVIILALMLCIQAYCDLALPEYTQDIIDVGIQNKGIEHIVPEKVTAEEYKAAGIFMTKTEKKTWNSIYTRQGSRYVLNVTDGDRLDELDQELLTPIVLTYEMGHTSVSRFRKIIRSSLLQQKNSQSRAVASRIDDMSVKEIGELLHYDIDTFRAEDENGTVKTYVDMRSMMQSMIDSGAMSDSAVTNAKKQMEKTIDSVGTQTLKSMGIAYAAGCDKAAGMNVNRIQKQYLWREGGRMFLMRQWHLSSRRGSGLLWDAI